jgi:hypothetical protein
VGDKSDSKKLCFVEEASIFDNLTDAIACKQPEPNFNRMAGRT